jgi:deazaflavin-dependent oxidoreductase (nitroreductase family)
VAESRSEYNAAIIAEFRANSGQVGGIWEGTPLLLLHHTGAKFGVSRVNPVAYLRDGPRYFVWAANGGAPKHPAWYHNLITCPTTRIEVGGETIKVAAKVATGEERERLFASASARYPQLAELAEKTERVIPIVVLTPQPPT